jgi:hypothetical protein
LSLENYEIQTRDATSRKFDLTTATTKQKTIMVDRRMLAAAPSSTNEQEKVELRRRSGLQCSGLRGNHNMVSKQE